jgi:hypothetical protein
VDVLGVTSIVRALNLRPRLYTKVLDHFHSSGIKLDRLSALWARAVLELFPSPVRINGRLVLVGDGIKAPKRGKKMPAVKLLHQQSESNTKLEYIMGHRLSSTTATSSRSGATAITCARNAGRSGLIKDDPIK